MICRFESEGKPFEIRTIREEDYQELAYLVNMFPDSFATPKGIEGTLQRQEYVGWVARHASGRLIGMMLMRVYPGYRDIVTLGVVPSFQRKGIGSAFVDLLKTVAVENALTIGCHVITPSRDIDQLLMQRGFVPASPDLASRYPSRHLGSGYIFCGELHDNPDTFRWKIRTVSPEFVGVQSGTTSGEHA